MINYQEVIGAMQSKMCHLLTNRERRIARLYTHDPAAGNPRGCLGETDLATVDQLVKDGLIARSTTDRHVGPGLERYDLTEAGKASALGLPTPGNERESRPETEQLP